MVHADKQIWHCFGCGKGGDIFSFVQEMEGLDFVEALKLLAKRAGVPIETFKSETDTSARNRVLEVNTKAAEFFHRVLMELPASQSAREYLERRGLKRETIIEWQIGFIPDQWDLLTRYFLKKGFGINDLVAAGLVIKREGVTSTTTPTPPSQGGEITSESIRGYYDRFRGRVMFPIADTHGNVVGFTGRVLVETENSGGKYVNTPQTAVYDKSRVLYGLSRAKTEIKNQDQVVLVEGQMDVIACHQAGMKNVVAASGTALTTEQIKLIKRYTTNIAMAFDADSAGENAGKRGITTAISEAMNVRVIRIPPGFAKDADECIKKDPTVWFTAVKEAADVMEWYLAIVLSRYDIREPKAKRVAATILLEQIRSIPNAVERDEWIKRVSGELGIELPILREELKKIKTLPSPKNNEPVSKVVERVEALTPYELLLQEFWSLLLKFPELYSTYASSLSPDYFAGTPFSALYQNAVGVYTKAQALDMEALRQLYATEAQNPIDILVLRPYRNVEDLSLPTAKAELTELWKRIAEQWNKERRKALEREMAMAEKSGEKQKMLELLQELQNLNV